MRSYTRKELIDELRPKFPALPEVFSSKQVLRLLSVGYSADTENAHTGELLRRVLCEDFGCRYDDIERRYRKPKGRL